MTKDVEDTLAELGPGYREVVERLVAAYAEPPARRIVRFPWLAAAYLAVASLAIFVGVGVVFGVRSPKGSGRGEILRIYTAAYARDADALERIVASQRSDGSWANDFLTRQNAAALRGADGDAMRVAYKKAVRYLRSKGLDPLSEEELRRLGDAAAKCV